MKYEEFKKRVIEAAEAEGLKDYELYYRSSEDMTVGTFRHEVNNFSSSTEGGVCFRTLTGGQMGYASTEDLSESEAVEIVRRAKANAAVLESAEEQFLGEAGGVYEQPERKAMELPTTEEMVRTALLGQDAAYAADQRVIDGTSSEVIRSTQRIAIYNSRGLDLQQENSAVVFLSAPVVSDGKEMNNTYEIHPGALSELDIQEVVGKAVESAVRKLGADVAPTGAYPVIFAPKAMAGLLATFSSAFSAEAAPKGLSLLGGKEGQVIASEKVTLTDDPFYAESLMPMPFDAEGMPTRKKNVIEKGVFTTLLHNLKTAAVAGVRTTGNASKSGYAGTVGVSPFTLLLVPGDLTEEELLAKAGNGVWIDSLQGMHAGANPISGDFSLQSGGFMIENGQKTKPVKAFTVAGNFYELLKNVEALSDKAETGGFGAGITSFAAPAVLVGGLSVAGK